MNINDILEKGKTLDIYEKRSCTDQYAELVFESRQKDKWDNILTSTLGPAVKPAGKKPSAEDQELAKSYGGIYGNQVLYRKEFDGNIIIAMLWPWQDGIHTTLKLALLDK